jgi:hypothetical protein
MLKYGHMNTPTPLRNAIFAALYIAGIVSLINWFGTVFKDTQDSIMAPMVMLSLLVLSAALMGYLFVYEPLRLYMDGQKKEGFVFFWKTLATFACCALIFVVLLFVLPRHPAVPGDSEGVACTMEAKICPDGSSVGRTGPNCEFAPCPTPKAPAPEFY